MVGYCCPSIGHFLYKTPCHSFCRWSRNPNGGPLESLGYKQDYRVDVDIPDQTWVEACSFHDVLIFNTGHWYVNVTIHRQISIKLALHRDAKLMAFYDLS
jgi:hypothetical protein